MHSCCIPLFVKILNMERPRVYCSAHLHPAAFTIPGRSGMSWFPFPREQTVIFQHNDLCSETVSAVHMFHRQLHMILFHNLNILKAWHVIINLSLYSFPIPRRYLLFQWVTFVLDRNGFKWLSQHINHNVWNEITYPLPNFNRATVRVWEWISNCMPHVTGHVITYPCCS